MEKDGTEREVEAPVGASMLEVAHKNDVDLEGACEGSLACSTCHVIVQDEEVYDRLGEISDDENDMLDTAFGLTETFVAISRSRISFPHCSDVSSSFAGRGWGVRSWPARRLTGYA